MFEFDLQMFADEENAEQEPVDTGVEDTGVSEPEESGAENQEEAGEKAPIPEELDGLPEEAAREVMAEAAKLTEQEGKEEPTEDKGEEDKAIIKNQAIPYSRWAQKLDENNKLKAELDNYKQKFGLLDVQQNAQPTQQATPQAAPSQPAMMKPVAPQQPPQMPQLNLTPDVMRQIEELKKQEALRMSGLTQEDLEGMEYMEENDPRKTRYQFALKMADSAIMNRIQQAQMEQARQAEAVLRAHDASVQEYNSFAQREAAEPDFQNVVEFARADFFFKKSPAEQQTLAAAYERIERNVASPAEVMLIKNYFVEAKNAYRGQHKTATKKNPMENVKKAGTFPRSQQVQGASDNDTGVSVATLEKMLREKTWDEIDPKYQKMLMGE